MKLRGIHTILRGMSLYEFKGDPSIPTKPARKKNLIPGEQTFYIIRHAGSCWTTPFEIGLPGLGTKEFNKEILVLGLAWRLKISGPDNLRPQGLGSLSR